MSGEYAFKDGLPYEDKPEWDYCNGIDRTFFRERIEGLRPAGDEQLCNDHPPRKIPEGDYDIGRGYFNVANSLVYTYDGVALGKLKPNESEEWVRTNCRVGL